jgi:hypothetical protein
MIMRHIVCLVLFIVVAPLRAATNSLDFTDYGRLMTTQFVCAPFPHASRTNGHRYQGAHFPASVHYSDSTVAVFVPMKFRLEDGVDVVIHFHGWKNSVEGTLRQFELIEQFTASGRNAVLVVPEGPKNAPDSSGGKLEDAGGFSRFVAELEAMLGRDLRAGTNVAVRRVILSGHSGGYKVMAAILDRGGLRDRISEIWIFDGLYADADKFQAWTARGAGRLLNIYTNGGGTKDDSEAMMQWMQTRRVKFLAGEDSGVSDGALRTNRVIFLHSDLGHSDVIMKRRTFQRFLETSVLEPAR